MSATLCWVWSDGRERVFGWVAEGYEEVVATPAGIRVSEAVDARLRRAFRGVTYELGFSRPGSDHDLLGGDWSVARTSRQEFDRVRFGDRAEVRFRFPRVHVLDVYRGAQVTPGGGPRRSGRWTSRCCTGNGSPAPRTGRPG